MENATKALLIAAAVLVVILVIALGVGIVNQGNAKEQATQAGDLINDKTTQASQQVSDILSGKMTEAQFANMINKYTKTNYNVPTNISELYKYTKQDVIEIINQFKIWYPNEYLEQKSIGKYYISSGPPAGNPNAWIGRSTAGGKYMKDPNKLPNKEYAIWVTGDSIRFIPKGGL